MAEDKDCVYYNLDKAILHVKNAAESFLNGLTSNDMDKPSNAFLDIHGKIIATFNQMRVSREEYYLLIERPFIKEVLNHLDKYLCLSRSTASVLDNKFTIFFDIGDHYLLNRDEFMIPQKKGKIVLTPRGARSRPVSQEEFTLFRLKNKIPVHGADYTREFVLNVDEEEFVSYTKGCFLGQEFVAKVHSRSKPSWKLTVKAEDDCDEEEKKRMTSKAFDKESGKTIGFVFIRTDKGN